jgi:hydroxymethylglutaryl-CoA lyase
MKIIECPRDAIQGIENFIPTEKKIKYLNSILNLGFDTIDFGSFVSAKAIPQLRDTAEVLAGLDLNEGSSKLLAIIANLRGATDACHFEEINYLGFPFSISETFQQRNTHSSIAESLVNLTAIQNLAINHNKELVVYLSMGFGNPYGDEWNVNVVAKWTRVLADMGIQTIAFSDTIGVSNAENITYLFKEITPLFPNVSFGAHLHANPADAINKLAAAYQACCRRFDVAINGYGGCPMASDQLTGNMATEVLLNYLNEQQIAHDVKSEAIPKMMADFQAMLLGND